MGFLLLCMACQAMALLPEPGIALWRTPAPLDGAYNYNSASSVITFNWDLKFNTTFSSCVFKITGPLWKSPVPTAFTKDLNSSDKGKPITWDSYGHDPGCYYATLTFSSDWCKGSISVEDEAKVGFLVIPSGKFKICKYLDVNGNGKKDPGELAPPKPDAIWQFNIEKQDGTVVKMVTTKDTGCTDDITVPVEEGGTTYYIREIVKPGWKKTSQNHANPFPVTIKMGENGTIDVGNWQPIMIIGFKNLDTALWPVMKPHWVGPQGQENLPISDWEPLPLNVQKNTKGIKDASIDLVAANGVTILSSTLSAADGSYSFGPLQYAPNFYIRESGCPGNPPECDTLPSDGGLTAWAGDYDFTFCTSPWTPNKVYFVPELPLVLPSPTAVDKPYEVYGDNIFYNRQLGRIWGIVCQTAMNQIPGLKIKVEKEDGNKVYPWIPPYEIPDSKTGVYEVEPLEEEPEGLRPGTYRLTPPAAPQNKYWEVTEYCNGGSGKSVYQLPSNGYVTVNLLSGGDVRVDFCLVGEPSNKRCYIPVTLSQTGWHVFADPTNELLPGGMIYNKFNMAFKNFSFNGKDSSGKLVIGNGSKTITFDATTASLKRLVMFLPQSGTPGKLDQSYISPWSSTPAGALAGETIALTLNIAYNDQRLMPRTPGYDFESFIVAKGLFKGRTVCEVLDIANKVLGGDQPARYGLSSYAALAEILKNINANYELVDLNDFRNGDYLIPNRTFGPQDPAHGASVPCR